MKPALVIFDWDGTLMDSTGRIVEAMQAAALDLEIPVFSKEEVRHIIGLGLDEAIAALAPNLDSVQARHLKERYIAHFVDAEENAGRLSLFPGIEEGLVRLADESVVLAVATGKSLRGLRRSLNAAPRIAPLFSAVRTADTTASKPDPLMLSELLDELGVAVSDSVLVGDSIYDMGMAQALGMRAVGVSWGVHSAGQLYDHGATEVVDTVGALMDGLLISQET